MGPWSKHVPGLNILTLSLSLSHTHTHTHTRTHTRTCSTKPGPRHGGIRSGSPWLTSQLSLHWLYGLSEEELSLMLTADRCPQHPPPRALRSRTVLISPKSEGVLADVFLDSLCVYC